MKTRATAWYNHERDEIYFGIKVSAGGYWYNFAEDGKPVFFKTETECDAKRKELRRQPELIAGKDGASFKTASH